MNSREIKIDLSDKFPNLPKAPIVEAIIHWTASPSRSLDPSILLGQLKDLLPDYPTSRRQQILQVSTETGPETNTVTQQHSWRGFRFDSEDNLNVANFTRDGFVFSRLTPYQHWDAFTAEATRLWQVYSNVAEPLEIEKLGVRFINVISIPNLEYISQVLIAPPNAPSGMSLPLKGFLYQNSFEIPGHPYNLNYVQTIQPPSPQTGDCFGLILDIDVATTQTIPLGDTNRRLAEMRWIKNKAFFSFLTPAAIDRIKE